MSSSSSVHPCVVVGYGLFRGGLSVYSSLRDDNFLDVDWDPFDTVAVSAAVMYQILFSKYGDSFGDQNSICASTFDSLASATEIQPDSSDYLKISFSFFGCFEQALRTISAVPAPYSAFNNPLRSAAKLLLSLHDADSTSEDNVLKIVIFLSNMVRDCIPAIEKTLAQYLNSKQTKPNTTPTPKAAPEKPTPVSIRRISTIICVVIIGLACIGFLYDTSRPAVANPTATPRHAASTQAPPTSTPVITPTPTAPLPRNGYTHYYLTVDPLAPLKITVPSGDEYYYVVLSSVVTRERIVSLFIHPGKTVEIDVPLGRYNIYYCCGTSWYGSELLFGDNGSYCTSDDVLVFDDDGEYYNGYEFTLYPVFDGNWDTRDVDYSDFPSA